NYGNTKDSGLSAPSEIGNFWYRWIPKDQIIIDENSISIDDKKAIIKNINSIINRYSKPLVIKNLYFVLRIRLIKELFPNAKFIYLKRDRLYVAQSIYLARTKNSKNPQSEWWSLNFPGYESLLTLPIEEQIAQQVYQLENLIQNELSEIFKENIMEIKYEELELNSIEKQFKSFIGTEKRKTFSLDQASFISGNTQKVDDDIFFRLKRELDKIFTE
ncbi:MAG: sulfotransferase, partial [Bacteroidota bacterium]|nr:sulfotransferase [Bacteroidota bacterium]